MNKRMDLSKGSILKLMFSLGVPAVIAQLINVLYNMVDRIYIGNIPFIGTEALTGVGVAFPLIIIISAFSAFVGYGGAPLASIKLGENKEKDAEKILNNGFIALIFISIVITILFFIFKEPLLIMFGASEATLQYSLDYLNIYLIGTIFVQLTLGLNTFISAQGKAKTAMISVLIGAVINIILDPILIFGFQMNVKGAALATVISQAVSCIWVVWFLLSKKSRIHLTFKNFKLDWKILGAIAALGISPFIMQSTESFVQIIFNSGMQKYGSDLYVGSITIILSIMQLVVLPVNGFCQGIIPLISYNFGANRIDRVKRIFKYLLILSLGTTTLCCVTMVAFPQLFVRIFTPDQQLIEIASSGLRIFISGIFLFGAQLACQVTFLALKEAKKSLFLAIWRKIILLIPLALILPIFMGTNGIYLSEPIADIIAALTTIFMFSFTYKKLNQLDKVNQELINLNY